MAKAGDNHEPPGTSHGAVAEGPDSPSRYEEKARSTAAYVAFPAEHLAAARGFGIMTDHFRTGFGEAGAGWRTQKRDFARRSASHGRGWRFGCSLAPCGGGRSVMA
jgi:hypothetical protein